MLNQVGGSKMDTLFKLVLIFVISVLSFSIGAFVGKQVSDTEHREALLETEHGGRSTASVHPDSTDSHPENALSEEDIASLTEEFVKVEKKELEKSSDLPNPVDAHKKDTPHTSKKLSKDQHNKVADSGYDAGGYKKITSNDGESHAEKDEEHAPKSDHKEKSTHPKKEAQMKVAGAANRVSHGKPPVKDEPKKRMPDAVLPKSPTSSTGKYTVQLASYNSEKEAQEYAASLKTKGFSAFYIPAQIKGQTWYRVSVGLFSTYDSAMEFRKELTAESGIKNSLVQKIVK